MRRKGYRGVGCVKRSFSRCKDVCRTYDKIQTAFAEELQNDESIVSFECNVLMENGKENQYTTDFVALKNDQTRMDGEAKSVFPTDDSLFKMLYLAMMDITKKWTGRRQDWSVIYAQLTIFFGDRIAE